MRNFCKVIFAFVFTFLFMGVINAESVVSDLKLECPSPVGYNTTFDCTLYGKVSDSKELSNIEVTDITNSRMFKTTNLINYDISRMSGTLKLATYTGKTNSTSGKASVGLRVAYNDIYFKYVTYRLKISDKNTNLKSITIDKEKIDDFNKEDYTYSVTTGKDSVALGASTDSKRASVSGTGTKKLSCGKNTSKLEVTSESGDKKTYTVNINKDCDLSNQVVLTGIKASTGNLSPKFDSKVTEYKLVVGKDTEKISLTGEAKSNLTVTGNIKDKVINPGFNKFTISVKASDNTKKDYVVNVIRQKDDAYLSSLSLSSGAFNFDKNTFLYETTVVYDTVNVDVRAVPEEQNSKVEISGGKNLQVGDNMINVKITSETESVNTYKIKVIRLKQDETIGDNPYIKDIKIKNYDINFDPNIVNYSLKIKNEKQLDITVETADEDSSYEILGNKNLKDGSVITIKSTSSGGFVKLYKIKISKANNYLYYIVSGIIAFCIIGLLIALFIINRKQKKIKFPIISSNLLSINKNKGKNKTNDLDNKKQINIDTANMKKPASNIEKNANRKDIQNSEMILCPRCGFKMPKTLSNCPNCKLKLK